jgi:hypothetical protein
VQLPLARRRAAHCRTSRPAGKIGSDHIVYSSPGPAIRTPIETAARRAAAAVMLCACGGGLPDGEERNDPDYETAVVLFIEPDGMAAAALGAERGPGHDADREGGRQRGAVRAALDRHGVPHAVVAPGSARFSVYGRARPLNWRREEGDWLAIVYDGTTDPEIVPDSAVLQHVERLRAGVR